MASSVAVVSLPETHFYVAVTISSLAAVSMTPALVSFCLSDSGSMAKKLRPGVRVGISLLAAGQEAVARRFSAPGRPPAEWREEHDVARWHDALLFDGSSAWLVADVLDAKQVGDHLLFVLSVVAARAGVAKALTYYDRDYGTTRRLPPRRGQPLQRAANPT